MTMVQQQNVLLAAVLSHSRKRKAVLRGVNVDGEDDTELGAGAADDKTDLVVVTTDETAEEGGLHETQCRRVYV